MLNIYLAGKITENDWRNTIVDGLPQRCKIMSSQSNTHFLEQWETMPRALFDKFHYVGPFPMDKTEHVFPRGMHAIDMSDVHPTSRVSYENAIQRNCLRAIETSDIVFIWIDAPTCYGTLVEAGYAMAKEKDVVIGIQKNPNKRLTAMYKDFWFVLRDNNIVRDTNPRDALYRYLEYRGYLWMPETFDSPIEQMFAKEWVNHGFHKNLNLSYQYVIENYRVDFACESRKIAIELDGYTHHSSKEQFTNDRKRQRYIESLGWKFLRFSGQEIYNDARSCTYEAYKFIRQYNSHL